jgi:uncharacterized membrane protein
VEFAYPLPWWGWSLILAGVALAGYGAYTRNVVSLSPGRRSLLAAIRTLVLLLVVFFLFRPVRLHPSNAFRNQVVPVLVDISRSMALADAGGQRRIDHAADLVTRQVLPAVKSRFQAEVLTFGESLTPSTQSAFSPTARRSDLSGALEAVTERYRGRRVAGVVVVSDGGDTGGREAAHALEDANIPVFAIGVGNAARMPDREILSLTVGQANVENALVDLSISAVSYGYGTDPIRFRVLANGRPIDSRLVTPAANGTPVHEVFLAAPDRAGATLLTVEIPPEAGEAVPENNRRSVLVSPPGRARRLLIVEGAPGFEHSFIKRALGADPSLEFDASVRKGQNDQGQDTFYIQATPSRGASLVSGFPTERRALYAYDAVVLANVDRELLNREQLNLTADFVERRGGGVLMLGARSFARGAFVGTVLENVLPLELSDRGGGLTRTAAQSQDATAQPFKVMLTPEGEAHPIMRLGLDRGEILRRWEQVPPLASTATLGAPHPGAQVLATTETPGGGRYPLVAVQRYGRGRSMIFSGEASWRWRMGLPSTDRTHEMFWRQTARWLSTDAPDPVELGEIDAAAAGDMVDLDMLVRDAEFVPIPDATVTLRVTLPGGASRELLASLVDAASGLYRARLRADQSGIYRVGGEARRGTAVLGSSNRWTLVGGADPEMADPRLNQELLSRLAAASGGRYLADADISQLPSLLMSAQQETVPPERQDLWNNVWTFALIVLLLSAEWILRRRWGMR